MCVLCVHGAMFSNDVFVKECQLFSIYNGSSAPINTLLWHKPTIAETHKSICSFLKSTFYSHSQMKLVLMFSKIGQ